MIILYIILSLAGIFVLWFFIYFAHEIYIMCCIKKPPRDTFFEDLKRDHEKWLEESKRRHEKEYNERMAKIDKNFKLEAEQIICKLKERITINNKQIPESNDTIPENEIVAQSDENV